MATTQTPRPPVGFTPNRDVDGSLVDWTAPTIEGDGYRVLIAWTVRDGLMLWVEPTAAAMTVSQALALAADLARAAGEGQ